MAEDITVFLAEGFSPSFYRHLEKFSRYIFKRYEVVEDWDSFYINARSKVEDVLSLGVFDPRKGNFRSFVFTMVRNECSKSASTKALLCLDAPELEHVNSSMVRSESPEVLTAKALREDFTLRAAQFCIMVEPDEFESNLINGQLTPMVFAYLWLVYTRGQYGIGL